MIGSADFASKFFSRLVCGLNLETAVGRVRVGCDAVRWQDATTLRAPAREAEQRRQRAAARLTRVRSALTSKRKANEVRKVNNDRGLKMLSSGQLPLPG